MTTCKIINCLHRPKRTPTNTNHVGVSWTELEVCPCCALELLEMGTVQHPTMGRYSQSYSCLAKIKEELWQLDHSEKKRTPEQEEHYRLKQSMKRRFGKRGMTFS